MPEPLTDDELTRTRDALAQEGSVRGAARVLGVDPKTIRNRRVRLAERGMLPLDPVMPGYAIKSVSGKAPDGSWVKQVREHGEEYAVPGGHIIKGESALVDADGRVIQKWVKTAAERQALELALRTIVDELKQSLPLIPATPAPAHVIAELANQFTITDLHFGMLAWGEETGGADYDLKIAERLLLDWFSAAIAMAPPAHTAIMAQLGDLMHHDALESVTPAHKHILDADSRLQKIIRVVVRVVRQIIAMLLRKHEHVHVIMASANHDPASSAWMRELLHSMYEDEPRIAIDNSPSLYYAFEHGKTALFYHHGHKRDVKSVDSVFAGMFRDLYGRSEHAYGHVGHRHSDAVVETNLMRVERHRTLAPPDAYASNGGWLTKQDAKVITYHKEFGEVSRITLSPQMVTGNSERGVAA